VSLRYNLVEFEEWVNKVVMVATTFVGGGELPPKSNECHMLCGSNHVIKNHLKNVTNPFF
jgi:hypothetical protein